MRVVNKLTKPGDIRRVDLTPDAVRVYTSDGQERLYRLSTDEMASIEMTSIRAWCGEMPGKKEGNGQSGILHGIYLY